MNIKKEVREIGKSMENIEKEIKREIKYAEKWMHERRKFLIKLAWVIGFIIMPYAP